MRPEKTIPLVSFGKALGFLGKVMVAKIPQELFKVSTIPATYRLARLQLAALLKSLYQKVKYVSLLSQSTNRFLGFHSGANYTPETALENARRLPRLCGGESLPGQINHRYLFIFGVALQTPSRNGNGGSQFWFIQRGSKCSLLRPRHRPLQDV